MQSNFLHKFKGKTAKLSKDGVASLLSNSNKKEVEKIQTIQNTIDNQKSTNEKNSKQKLFQKQNLIPITIQNKSHCLQGINPSDFSNSNENYLQKQKKIIPENTFNNSQHKIKLPKISVKRFAGQSDEIPNLNPKSYKIEKLVNTLLTETSQIQQKNHFSSYRAIESLLEKEALNQLKRLNNFEMTLQQVQAQRRPLDQQKDLIKSKYARKGVTVHY